MAARPLSSGTRPEGAPAALSAGVSPGGRPAPPHANDPLATGVVELDRALPRGGFPRGAVTELCSSFGLGVPTSLALAACAAAQLEARHEGRPAPWCAFLDPTGSLHGPGVAAAGVELGRLLVVRPPLEALARLAARLVTSGAFAVVVIDTAGVPGAGGCASLASWPTATRRLALAAEAGSTVVLLLTDHDAVRPVALPVAMRVELQQPAPGRLSLRVAKERRGQVSGWSSFAWGVPAAAADEIVPLHRTTQR
ncbi:MAG TPA: recombinase A [Polyangiaceae bacterium]|nr:recombinase A [Polyangiaceae bacterium]